MHTDTLLRLPQHRRVVTQFAQGADGVSELRLYYGDKEISFDEPDMFAFGQALAQQSRFAAGAATGWGPGYAWSAVQPLLDELLRAGVLQRVHAGDEHDDAHHADVGERAAPLPPGPCAQPQMWTDTAGCEALMQQLTGRRLELGWLEMVLPVFRVAHAALDSDGRQVGEANVFPKALRLDVPTRWRACIYPGTRYQTGRPMNVSALKAMRQHWPAMMGLLSAVRQAYLDRYDLDGRQWTVGQLERLATCVLALPTYLLMQQGEAHGRVANGELHAALSCLFRVTDGLRMTLHQMLFVPIGEPTLKPDAPVGSAAILAYAERNYSLHSEHGVCAGPQAMIEEFLAVLVDGAQGPADAQMALVAEPALTQALQAIEPAIDYALLGLRVHAAVFSLWPLMARTYERLNRAAQAWAGKSELCGPAVQRLAQRLQECVHGMQSGTYVAQAEWRADREAVYADMYAQSGRGLSLAVCVGMPTQACDEDDLREQLRPVLSCRHAQADRSIEALLQATLGRLDGADLADVRRLRDTLMEFCVQVQAALRVAGRAQAQLNRLLGRMQPQRPFDAVDLDLVHQLQGAAAPRRLPYLFDEIESLLHVRVLIDAESLRVEPTADLQPHIGAATCHRTSHPHESPGTVPTMTRAPRTQHNQE